MRKAATPAAAAVEARQEPTIATIAFAVEDRRQENRRRPFARDRACLALCGLTLLVYLPLHVRLLAARRKPCLAHAARHAARSRVWHKFPARARRPSTRSHQFRRHCAASQQHNGHRRTRRPCRRRWSSWEATCPDGEVDLTYRATWPRTRPVAPEPRCRFRAAAGKCQTDLRLPRPDAWFLDADRGGPGATTRAACRARQTGWEATCGAPMDLRFEGPGGVTPRDDGASWDITDVDGATLTLTPNEGASRGHRSCFDMVRTPAAPVEATVHFCYPTLNIVGTPKAGTSALYSILAQHPRVHAAHARKEYCLVRGDRHTSIFRHLCGFARVTKDMPPDHVMVNGCISYLNALELEYLLRGPRSLLIDAVRDAADRSWATYNYWCGWEAGETDCAFRGRARPGVHPRSPRAPWTLLIPDPAKVRDLYTKEIAPLDAVAPGRVHVVAMEEVRDRPAAAWDKLSRRLRAALGYELPPHPRLAELAARRVNANDKAAMLPETRALLTAWWDECEKLANRTSWPYHCAE